MSERCGRVVLAMGPCALALLLPACGSIRNEAQEEALKNTVACEVPDGRIVVRFERGEVRVLLPSGERVNLYEVPSGAGARYTNGSIDMIGTRTNLQLVRQGGKPEPLQACAPFAPPEEKR